jgi:hypothetical protein
MTEPAFASPRRNYFYAAIAAADWPVFHRRRCGPVADPGRTIKPARPVVGVALRWRSFFLAGVAIAIQTLCPSNAIGELPADAPAGCASCSI